MSDALDPGRDANEDEDGGDDDGIVFDPLTEEIIELRRSGRRINAIPDAIRANHKGHLPVGASERSARRTLKRPDVEAEMERRDREDAASRRAQRDRITTDLLDLAALSIDRIRNIVDSTMSDADTLPAVNLALRHARAFADGRVDQRDLERRTARLEDLAAANEQAPGDHRPPRAVWEDR